MNTDELGGNWVMNWQSFKNGQLVKYMPTKSLLKAFWEIYAADIMA